MNRKHFALAYLLPLVLTAFICSCSPQQNYSSGVPAGGYSRAVTIKAGNFAPGQLQAHYLKHGYQFGNITRGQYLEGARKLLDAPAGGDILEKIRPNGDMLHYKLSTGEFAVMSADGRIRTYFKADYRYWLKQ